MSSTLRPGNCCSRRHHHRHVDDTPSVCQSVSSPCSLPSLSAAPRDVSRVEIVLAVIVNATDAGKCGYNNLCTCNDRQQSVKEHQPVPTTSNPSPSPYPSGTQKPNLNPNLIPKRVTTVFCQLVRLMCNEMPCVCVSACVCECLSVLLKGLCVCALPTRSP